MSSSESDVRERLRQRLQQPSRGDQVRAELKARLGRTDAPAAPEEETSGLGVFLTRLLKGAGDAVLATPSATGDVLAAAAAAPALVPGGKSPGEAFREQQQQLPASAIRAIPRPTTDEVIAGGRAAMAAVPGGVSPGEQFRYSMEDAERRRTEQEQEHPIAATAGDIGGDIAALLIAKRPLQPSIRRFEQRLANPVTRSADEARTLMRDVDRIFRSRGAQLSKRGAFRAFETGLEGAFLEVLGDAENDPLLAAALASGGQLLGSGSIETLRGMANVIPNKRLVSLGVSALSTAGLLQMLKSVTPGGRDRFLESAESGYDKATIGVVMGAIGAMLGGRGRGKDVSQLTENMLDGLATTGRGGALSVLSRWVGGSSEEQAEIESALNNLMADPGYDGETGTERAIIKELKDAIDAEKDDESEPGETRKVDGRYRGTIDRSARGSAE